MANTIINTPELLNLDSTTGATVLAKGTISERPSVPTFNADYLIIAGGGGGGGGRGGNATVWSSGGGGGGYQYNAGIKFLIDTNYTITVGDGGAGGAGNGTPVASGGENSSIVASGIINEVATGGVGGGQSSGASGGNSGSLPSNSGGTSYTAGAYWGAGGGAGAGSNGSNGSNSSGGNGGNGYQSSITGTAAYYGGGGGGGIYAQTGGSGGSGGGGNGKGTTTNGDNGVNNTGGGGGGAGSAGASAGVNFTGGTGGSGIVILRYPNSYTINIGAGLTSSTISDGSEKVTSFTAGAGTITFSGATSSNLDEYPIDGTLRFNTDTNKTEYYDGTSWYEIVDEYASGFIGPATNYFDTKLYTGNGGTQSIGGYINGSGSFNGSSSKIESDVLQSTNMTFSFWFKTTTTGESEYLMGFNTSGSAGYITTRLNTNDTIGIAYWNGSTYAAVSSSAITRDTNYNHICITISGTSYTIYYNGSSIGSGTLSGFLASSRTDFVMGFDAPTGTTSYMNGSLDQVRIYNVALSSSDVAALNLETAATASTAAFPSGQTAIATYTMDTSANGLLTTTDLSTVDYPAGAGCVALYEMNGNSNDTSNTYNGTPTDISYQGGAFGQAAVFNGSSSVITLGATHIPSSSDFSFSCWVNKISSAYGTILGQASSGTSGRFSFNYNASNQFTIGIETTTLITTSAFDTNQWHHLVFIRDGNDYTIYVNGNSAGTGTNSVGLQQRTTDLGGLTGFGGVANSLDGSIDQVRIFNTALTQSQVTTLARGIATSYSGTATNVNFNGHLDFQPDFVWIKARTTGASHSLQDTVNGEGQSKNLYSDNTGYLGQYGVYGFLSTFEANGFFVDAGSGSHTNANNQDYVAWVWKGGGDAVLNEEGSIDSQVSANKDSGFSIVKVNYGSGEYTQTAGHGLSQQPELIISKNTDSSSDWFTFSEYGGSLLGTNNILKLNTTAAATSDSFFDISTSTFKTGYSTGAYNAIAYCWHSVAGYSKIGSYEGNGTSAATTITTGFEPSWVMIKRTDSANSWVIFDDKRDTTSPLSKILYADASDAEVDGGTTTSITISSTGFSMSTSQFGGSINTDGGQYLYMAFA